MTAEALIMNKHAVVLAADSAATVSNLSAGAGRDRYFKGSNKIFQLSNHNPVGVMIYGNLELHGVPWEILIKEFREENNEVSFEH